MIASAPAARSREARRRPRASGASGSPVSLSRMTRAPSGVATNASSLSPGPARRAYAASGVVHVPPTASREGALRERRRARLAVGQRLRELQDLGVVRPRLHPEGPLPDRRQHLVGARARWPVASRRPRRAQTGGGQHQGVVLALLELSEAGVDVPSDGGGDDIRTAGQELDASAEARGADARAPRESADGRGSRRHQDIARVLAARERGEVRSLRALAAAGPSGCGRRGPRVPPGAPRRSPPRRGPCRPPPPGAPWRADPRTSGSPPARPRGAATPRLRPDAISSAWRAPAGSRACRSGHDGSPGPESGSQRRGERHARRSGEDREPVARTRPAAGRDGQRPDVDAPQSAEETPLEARMRSLELPEQALSSGDAGASGPCSRARAAHDRERLPRTYSAMSSSHA